MYAYLHHVSICLSVHRIHLNSIVSMHACVYVDRYLIMHVSVCTYIPLCYACFYVNICVNYLALKPWAAYAPLLHSIYASYACMHLSTYRTIYLCLHVSAYTCIPCFRGCM
jgi:hypothetical protein